MNTHTLLVRYHEIALKGDNRRWFEDRLVINLRKILQRTLGDTATVEVKRVHSRILVKAPWSELTRTALQRVFGLSNFSLMRSAKTNKNAILEGLLEEFDLFVEKNGVPKSFRIKTRRSDKALPETSVELDRDFGSAVMKRYPSLQVNLDNPDLTLGVEVRFDDSFIWTEKIAGQGGLPVGTNASVLTLLSGGLDSPVAALQILRRGCTTGFIHFFGTPFVEDEVLEKVNQLAQLVNRYQPDPLPLIVIPFGKIQEKIAQVTSPKLRTVLYRRMMIRIANEVAINRGAKALVTGESVGQVASQTIENLAAIDCVSQIPILRPLITCDKAEIIEKAHKWDTFETSIQPGLDCCTLFADRHPSLRTTLEAVEMEEKNFSVSELVQEGLMGLTVLRPQRDRLLRNSSIGVPVQS